jgi:DNA excision repair protein ERCC-4
MREEWKKYLLSKAELHGMRMRNKKKPIAQPKWAGVMIGKGSHGGPQEGESRDHVRSAQSEEQQALMAAAAEVAVANIEVIALGEDVAVRKGLRSRGRGRGRGRGRTKGISGRTGKGTQFCKVPLYSCLYLNLSSSIWKKY